MRYLTADLPGTGGRYKEEATHFQVDEIPLYPCCGQGEHLFLWIEKVGISTRELVRQLSRALNLKDGQVGYAGLKDARALTRQQISIPATKAAAIESLQLTRARVLKSDRHRNKLRLGHLAGNRFNICLQGTGRNAAAGAGAILSKLAAIGAPNSFGEQRYGILGNSHLLGRYLLRGDFEQFSLELLGDPEIIHDPKWQAAALKFRAGDLENALALLPPRLRDEHQLLQALKSGKSYRQAAMSLPKNLRRLFLSAYQSYLFDQLLVQRLPDLGQLVPGDLAVKHVNGACFSVTDPQLEQARADILEISPSAPLYGYKSLLASGTPGERERQLLKDEGLDLGDWKLANGLAMPGERRPLRVPLQAPDVKLQDDGLWVQFSLPRGSYATSVLREIIKPE